MPDDSVLERQNAGNQEWKLLLPNFGRKMDPCLVDHDIPADAFAVRSAEIEPDLNEVRSAFSLCQRGSIGTFIWMLFGFAKRWYRFRNGLPLVPSEEFFLNIFN